MLLETARSPSIAAPPKPDNTLLIGTIGPALILLRVPQAAILSTRLIYPVLFLARILPPRIQ